MRHNRIRAAIVITSEASLRAPQRLRAENETFAVMTGPACVLSSPLESRAPRNLA